MFIMHPSFGFIPSLNMTDRSTTALRSYLPLLLNNLLPLLWVPRRVILVVSILSWVGHLIFERLDEFVEEDCNQGSNNWSNPYSKISASLENKDESWTYSRSNDHDQILQ